MRKNRKAIVIALSIILIILAIFAACSERETSVDTGTDPLGREYGSVYNIDDYASGNYRVTYEIGGTSDMGKWMIQKNCEDYIGLAVTEVGHTLYFYCKGDLLQDVTLDGQLSQVRTKDGNQVHSFAIERAMLDQEMEMQCMVKIMHKQVKFTIRVDLNTAILVK